MFRTNLLRSLLLLLTALPLPATTILTFSGLRDGEQVLSFYGGGAGSLGSRYFNYGVTFSAGSIVLVDADGGGTGNFANAPSPFAVLFSTTGILSFNVPDGFTEALSFYFVTYAGNLPGSVRVFSGLNGTGQQLGSATLNALNQICPGDPQGSYFGCFQPVSIPLAATARSAVFTLDPMTFGIDNIAFRLPAIENPSLVLAPIPEPAPLALVGVTLVSLWGWRRRSRRA